MSTLRINNIEAQSVPASPTIDEKVKVTNSSGDILVNIDGKTSGITTIGINTTDGNIKFDANSNVLITGILTATTLAGNFTPDSLEIGSNIKLGNAGVITATTFVGNLTGNPTGTLQTAAQPNITSVGTLSALTVSGNINVSSTDPTIVFVDSDNNPDFDIKAGGGRFAIRDSTNNAERLRIDSTGRISAGKHGVGTYNDASEWFKVQSNDTAANISIVGSNDTHSSLNLGDEDDFNIQKIRSDHTNNSLQFFTDNTERVRVLSNGHVAIGHDIANDTGMFKVIAADGQSDDQYVGQFKNLEATANRNWGLLVQAGSSSTDESLRVRNYANNRDHLLIRGDGVKVTQSRGLNYAKTYEFNYNDGAGGGVQTVNLLTISTYNDVTSAVAEVTYVGVYGTANNYISSSKWICGIRRGSNNSVWSATAAESTAGGNSSTSSLDIQWNNGVLQAVTVGPWMGWTVNVRLTILNGDITVNV